jgi:hypothetical protein
MKFKEERPLANPEAAMAKLLEIAIALEADQAGRISVDAINHAFEATANLMTGASGDKIVNRYRQRVAANAKRLGRLNSGASRNSLLKRTPRRRK